MHLYEMANEYRALQSAIEQGLIAEDEIAESLEAVALPIEERVDNLATWVKELEGDINTLATEIKRLQERKKAAEALQERIKDSIMHAMVVTNAYKYEGRNKVTSRKSKKVVVYDMWALINSPDADNYLRYKDPEVNKVAVADALKNGVDVKGCSLEDNLSVIIR